MPDASQLFASKKYDNLRELMLNPVSDKESNQNLTLIRVEAREMNHLTDAFKQLPGYENHYTPRSEYLLKLLQPLLEDLLFLGVGYEPLFDRFEVLYAMQHAYDRKQDGAGTWGPVGRFGWKHSPIQMLVDGKRQTNPSEIGRTLVLFERGFSQAVGLG